MADNKDVKAEESKGDGAEAKAEAAKPAAATAASSSEPAPDPEDPDLLAELLDKSLGDFPGGPSGQLPPGVGYGIPPPGAVVINPEMAKQAASEFQNMLKNLTDIQKSVVEQTKKEAVEAGKSGEPAAIGGGSLTEAIQAAGLGAAQPSAAGPPGMPPGMSGMPSGMPGEIPFTAEEEAKFAEQLLQNLQGLSTKAQKVSEASNAEEFESAMKEMHDNEQYTNEFLPFMQGLMGSLLSKEMMYPSIKEMTDKYPAWLEKEEAKTGEDRLKDEDLERYKAQLKIMEEACKEYESEKPDDTEEIIGARFEKLVGIMQHMQMCGHPPEELVGEMPPGWSLGPGGLPQVENSDQAAENCSIM